MNKISLDNYDPQNPNLALNSPRSLKACQRVGINQNDLYRQNDKIQQMQYQQEKQHAPNLTLDQFRHYQEIRRQKKLEMVQQMREQISREVKLEDMRRSTGNMPRSNMDQLNRLEQENHHFQHREEIMINKIKKRQKQEIAQMLNSEFRIQAIKQKADEKQQKILQKEEVRERMFELQRQQALIKKQNMEAKLKQKEKIDEQKIKELEKKAEVKEKAFQNQKYEKELMRKGVIESRDGFRHQKKIRLFQQIKEFQKIKEINFKLKKEEIEKKDHQRQILIQSLYHKRREENEMKRLFYEQKLKQVRKHEVKKIENAREAFLTKEEEIEKKQLELQRIKQMQIEQWQEKKEKMNEIVHHNLKVNEKKNLSKTLQYFQKMEKDTMSVQSQLLQQQKIVDSKLAPQLEKLMLGKTRPQSAKNLNIFSPKVQDQLRDRLTPQLDERAEYLITMKQLQQKQRAIQEELKHIQVRDNLKIVENKRQQYLQQNMEKIESVKRKLEEREAERERIIQMRHTMQRAMNHEKEILNEQFQKRAQKNNVNLHQLAEAYGIYQT